MPFFEGPQESPQKLRVSPFRLRSKHKPLRSIERPSIPARAVDDARQVVVPDLPASYVRLHSVHHAAAFPLSLQGGMLAWLRFQEGLYPMHMRPVILAAIEAVAAEQNKALKPLTDDLVLLDSGLDSLCFAILVTRLEDEVGFDPFTLSDDVYFPVTLGDFIRFYDDAARSQAAPTLAA